MPRTAPVPRHWLLAGLSGALIAAAFVASITAIAQELASVGSADAPQWSFTVVSVEDPQTGEITRPSELDPSERIIAVQVIITNDSDQPLDFSVSDIRLIDRERNEYRAGDVTGVRPRLVSQNLPDGERTRGWVWFAIPEGTEMAEIRFVGPRPVFRVPVVSEPDAPFAPPTPVQRASPIAR